MWGLKTSSILFLSAIIIMSFLPIGGGLSYQPEYTTNDYSSVQRFPLISGPIRISAADGYDSMWPDIVVNGNNLEVVWVEYYPKTTVIYHATSTNKGLTWSYDPIPYDTSGIGSGPSIVTNIYGFIYMVFERNNEVFYTYKDWYGWHLPVMLSDDDGFSSVYPRIAINPTNGTVHVVWADAKDTPLGWSIYHKKSGNGWSWSNSTRVANVASCESYYPDVAVDSIGRVHVVWTSWDGDSAWTYYSRSEDSGQNWTDPTLVDTSTNYLSQPRVGTDSNNDVHVTFIRGNVSPWLECVGYNATNDGGNEFHPEDVVELSDWYYDVNGSDIAVGPAYIYVVWRIYDLSTMIHYAKLGIGTTNWFFYSKNAQTIVGDQQSTAVAEDSYGLSHVVWSDGTSIWYYYNSSAVGQNME